MPNHDQPNLRNLRPASARKQLAKRPEKSHAPRPLLNGSKGQTKARSPGKTAPAKGPRPQSQRSQEPVALIQQPIALDTVGIVVFVLQETGLWEWKAHDKTSCLIGEQKDCADLPTAVENALTWLCEPPPFEAIVTMPHSKL